MVRRAHTRRDGFSLLLALVVMLLVFEAAALVAGSLGVRLRSAREDRTRVALDALADGALADALARLDADRFYSGEAERDIGAGHLWSDVERIGAEHGQIEASATLGGERRAVEAEARLTGAGLRVVAWRVR
jgi:hypothetical protein